jgi:hypothetical protein
VSSKTVVTLGILFAGIFLGANALAGTAALRFDGTYHRTGSDAVTQHFRFYPDGTVISAATPVAMTPVKIARWFRRDWPVQAKGRYATRDRSIDFTIKSDVPGELPAEFRRKVPGLLKYAGTIGPDHLRLRRAGEATTKRFDFIKIQFAK